MRRERVWSTFALTDDHKRNDFLRPRALRFSTRRLFYLLMLWVLVMLLYAASTLFMLSFLPPLRVAFSHHHFVTPKQQENIKLKPNGARSDISRRVPV